MSSRFASAAVFLLFALAGLMAAPAPASQADQKKAELADLKSRVEALRDEVGKSEASRADVVEQLRETEQAISEAGRRVRDLAQAQGAAQEDMAKLQKQARALQTQIDAQQAQLATLLHRQYLAGEHDALSRFLGGDDPNQPARDAHYLRALSQAKVQWLSGLRLALEEKSRLAEAVKAKSAELAEIEAKSREEQAELLLQQQKHRAVLQKIAANIKAQRREINSLKRDGARLTRLIEGLTRIVRRPAPAKPAPRPREAAAGPSEPAGQEVATPEAPEEPSFVEASGIRFSSLKGKLRFPIQGALAHRFGAKMSDGFTTWKGLFIRAAGGDVAAVAAGRVVFAQWVNRYGNLLVLDHGEGYLTVYGNNRTLYKGVGDVVAAGDAIAAVGSSGGNEETGLYFQLTFQGHATDPLKWLAGKLGK